MRKLADAGWCPIAIGAAAAALGIHGARAQAPLSIEQLLAAEHRWQAVAAIDHGTTHGTPFEERRDTNASILLRYGVTSRLEVSGRFTRREQRLASPVGEQQREGAMASLGLAWLARAEDRWPALLLELRADPRSRFAGQERDGGAAFSATAYRSIDPVVLSVTAAREHPGRYRSAGQIVDPGERWRLEPLVSFAVNPGVTLLGGATFTRGSEPRIDGRTVFARRTAIGYRAGLGYAPDARNTLFLTVDRGGAGDRLAVQWFHEF